MTQPQGPDAIKTLLARIFKVTEQDDGTVTLSSVLAAEELDDTGEIFDYASSKPYFENWNAKFAEKTDGQSVGNLRSMHQLIAAGKFTAMAYDDDQKLITCDAHVIDMNEAKKVLAGVYTGLSIGAKYVKKWKLAGEKGMRWTADPFEGSLADNPAMPSATFLRKTLDGREMACKFQASPSANSQVAQKGMYTVQDFARLCNDAASIQQSIQWEEEYEKDGSQCGAKMKEIVGQLCALLVEYTQEEAGEITAPPPAPQGAEVQSKAAEGKKTEVQAMDKDKTGTPALVAVPVDDAEKARGKFKDAARKAARAHKALSAAHSDAHKAHKALAKHIESDEGKKAHKAVSEAFEAMGDHIDTLGSALGSLTDEPQDSDEGAEKAMARRTVRALDEVRDEMDERFGNVEKAILAMAEGLGNMLGQPRPTNIAVNAAAATVTKTQDGGGAPVQKTATELAKEGDVAGAIRQCQMVPRRTFAFGPMVQ